MPRDDPAERAAFSKVRRAENEYGARLRRLAAQVGELVKGNPPTSAQEAAALANLLRRYGDLILPWATAVSKRMLAEVSLRDAKAWEIFTRGMGYSLRREILQAPTGHVMQELMAQQVSLITSIPLEAASRVHELVQNNMSSGARFAEIVPEIMATGAVTKARATLIARTETSRAASTLLEARARFVGSDGYIWRTAKDVDVRPSKRLPPKEFARLNTKARGSHRLLEGTKHSWNDPPIAGPKGQRAHPGCIFNCRCYPEPLLPSSF